LTDDDEINLEIEGETTSEEPNNKMSESESENETSAVACWWVVRHGNGRICMRGNDATDKAIGPSKRQESTWGDKTYRETISEKIFAR
jgi:hypothetical protein